MSSDSHLEVVPRTVGAAEANAEERLVRARRLSDVDDERSARPPPRREDLAQVGVDEDVAGGAMTLYRRSEVDVAVFSVTSNVSPQRVKGIGS